MALLPPSLAGSLGGDGGILVDLAFHTEIVMWGLWLFLIVYSRRMFGDLLIRLDTAGVLKRRESGDEYMIAGSPFHRLLEWGSRLTPRRAVFWAVTLLLMNTFNYYQVLSDDRQHWVTSPAEPGTLLHAFRVGSEQPNLSGFWMLLLMSALGGYLILLVIRVFVIFACLTRNLAADPTLRVSPCHPDGTGGLLPIGKAALQLSLFTFSAGVFCTAMTLQSVLIWESDLTLMFWLLWGGYLALGPSLFFLPLLPLRRAMRNAKHSYLLEAGSRFRVMETRHRSELGADDAGNETIEGLDSLGTLLERAEEMAVWPFDRKTFQRFAGVLISPLAPIVVERSSPAIQQLLSFFRLA